MARYFPVGDLGDSHERRTWIPTYSIFLMVFSTFFVSVRLTSRILRTTGSFGIDDVLLIFAYIFGTGFTIMFIVGAIHFGYDRHTSAFTPYMAPRAGLIGWLGELLYLLSSNCTKIVVLLFYRRLIVSGIRKGLMWAIYVSIALTVVYTIAFVVPLFFECSPFYARWMQFDFAWAEAHPNFHCKSRSVVVPVSGALSVFGDVYALAIPWIIISDLQMPKRQKMLLYGVFGFGITVVAAGIVRTIYLDMAERLADVSWLASNAVIASDAEIHLGMICASAPASRALFRRYLKEPITKLTSHSTSKSLSGPSEGKRSFKFGSHSTGKTWSSSWSSTLKSSGSMSYATDKRGSTDSDQLIMLQSMEPARIAPGKTLTLDVPASHSQDGHSASPSHDLAFSPALSPMTRAKSMLSTKSFNSHRSFGDTHERGLAASQDISVAYEPLVPQIPPLPSVHFCSCGVSHAAGEQHWGPFADIRF